MLALRAARGSTLGCEELARQNPLMPVRITPGGETERRRARVIADSMLAVTLLALAFDIGLKLVDHGFNAQNTGDIFFHGPLLEVQLYF